MEQFWRKKSFKALSKEWNKKLADTGFTDAEIELKQERVLRQRSTNSYRQACQLERDSRLEYYMLMGNLAYNTIFPNELERSIMIWHAEGLTIKEIMQEIEKLGSSIYRGTVRFIIRRWQVKWGVKNWNREQLRLKKV